MGFGINASQNISVQHSRNKIFQSASNTCNANCKSAQQDITVAISNSTTGNIDFDQACQAEALCTMRNTLKSISEQHLKSSQVAEAKNMGICLGITCINASTNISSQSLENSVTQTITNTCDANTSNLQSNITVLVSDSTVGNIDFGQTGSATANCAITNTASAQVSQSAVSSQTAISETDDFAVVILLAIAIVVVIIVVGYLANQKRKNDQASVTKQNKDVLQAIIQGKQARVQEQQLRLKAAEEGIALSDLGLAPVSSTSSTTAPPTTVPSPSLTTTVPTTSEAVGSAVGSAATAAALTAASTVDVSALAGRTKGLVSSKRTPKKRTQPARRQSTQVSSSSPTRNSTSTSSSRTPKRT